MRRGLFFYLNLRDKSHKKVILFILSFFIIHILSPIPGYSQLPSSFTEPILNLPLPGTFVKPTPAYAPTVLRGLKFNTKDPFNFDFVIDLGDSSLSGEQLEKETNKLLKYFLTALTIPEKDLWVNLSPYEEQRIIPEKFGMTEMGKDLLEQDYILKQLTASMIYPEDGFGQDFWKRVYKKLQAVYGTTNIPVNTFNKVWIVPDKARVYENRDTAFIVKSHLKVLLEGDYFALVHNLDKKELGTDQINEGKARQVNDVSSQILREVVLPEIEKEVNEGGNFAPLRQIYNSLILATWFKRSLKEGALAKIYFNRNKISGVDTADKQIHEKIYDQYIEAYKAGVFDYIKEERNSFSRDVVHRRYVAGGANFTSEKMAEAYETTFDMAEVSQQNLVDAKIEIKKFDENLYGHQDVQNAKLDTLRRLCRSPTPAFPFSYGIHLVSQELIEHLAADEDLPLVGEKSWYSLSFKNGLIVLSDRAGGPWARSERKEPVIGYNDYWDNLLPKQRKTWRTEAIVNVILEKLNAVYENSSSLNKDKARRVTKEIGFFAWNMNFVNKQYWQEMNVYGPDAVVEFLNLTINLLESTSQMSESQYYKIAKANLADLLKLLHSLRMRYPKFSDEIMVDILKRGREGWERKDAVTKINTISGITELLRMEAAKAKSNESLFLSSLDKVNVYTFLQTYYAAGGSNLDMSYIVRRGFKPIPAGVARIDIVLTASQVGRGDVPNAQRVAQEMKKRYPGKRVILHFFNKNDYEMYQELFPDNFNVMVQLDERIEDQRKLRDQEVVIFVTIPWSYGYGIDPIKNKLLGKVNILIPMPGWGRSELEEIIVDDEGTRKVMAMLPSGLGFDESGLLIPEIDRSKILPKNEVILKILRNKSPPQQISAILTRSQWGAFYINTNLSSIFPYLRNFRAHLTAKDIYFTFISNRAWEMEGITEAAYKQELENMGYEYMNLSEFIQRGQSIEIKNPLIINLGAQPEESFIQILGNTDRPLLISGTLTLEKVIALRKVFIYVPNHAPTEFMQESLKLDYPEEVYVKKYARLLDLAFSNLNEATLGELFNKQNGIFSADAEEAFSQYCGYVWRINDYYYDLDAIITRGFESLLSDKVERFPINSERGFPSLEYPSVLGKFYYMTEVEKKSESEAIRAIIESEGINEVIAVSLFNLFNSTTRYRARRILEALKSEIFGSVINYSMAGSSTISWAFDLIKEDQFMWNSDDGFGNVETNFVLPLRVVSIQQSTSIILVHFKLDAYRRVEGVILNEDQYTEIVQNRKVNKNYQKIVNLIQENKGEELLRMIENTDDYDLGRMIITELKLARKDDILGNIVASDMVLDNLRVYALRRLNLVRAIPVLKNLVHDVLVPLIKDTSASLLLKLEAVWSLKYIEDFETLMDIVKNGKLPEDIRVRALHVLRFSLNPMALRGLIPILRFIMGSDMYSYNLRKQALWCCLDMKAFLVVKDVLIHLEPQDPLYQEVQLVLSTIILYQRLNQILSAGSFEIASPEDRSGATVSRGVRAAMESIENYDHIVVQDLKSPEKFLKEYLTSKGLKLGFTVFEIAGINATKGLIDAIGLDNENVIIFHKESMPFNRVQSLLPGYDVRSTNAEKYGHLPMVEFLAKEGVVTLKPAHVALSTSEFKVNLPKPTSLARIGEMRKSLNIDSNRKVMMVVSPNDGELKFFMSAYHNVFGHMSANERPLVIVALRDKRDNEQMKRLKEDVFKDDLVKIRDNYEAPLEDMSQYNILVMVTMGEVLEKLAVADIGFFGHNRNLFEGASQKTVVLTVDGPWPDNQQIKQALERRKAVEIFSQDEGGQKGLENSLTLLVNDDDYRLNKAKLAYETVGAFKEDFVMPRAREFALTILSMLVSEDSSDKIVSPIIEGKPKDINKPIDINNLRANYARAVPWKYGQNSGLAVIADDAYAFNYELAVTIVDELFKLDVDQDGILELSNMNQLSAQVIKFIESVPQLLNEDNKAKIAREMINRASESVVMDLVNYVLGLANLEMALGESTQDLNFEVPPVAVEPVEGEAVITFSLQKSGIINIPITPARLGILIKKLIGILDHNFSNDLDDYEIESLTQINPKYEHIVNLLKQAQWEDGIAGLTKNDLNSYIANIKGDFLRGITNLVISLIASTSEIKAKEFFESLYKGEETSVSDFDYLTKSVKSDLGKLAHSKSNRNFDNLGATDNSQEGGVDFTAINLQFERWGERIEFDEFFDNNSKSERINIEGFYPVIKSIAPLNNIQLFLGEQKDCLKENDLKSESSECGRESKSEAVLGGVS